MFFPEVNTIDEVERQVEDVLENDYEYSKGVSSGNEKHFAWSQRSATESKLYIKFAPLGALQVDLRYTENDRGSVLKSYRISSSFSKGYFQHEQVRGEDITVNLITELKEALDKTSIGDWCKYKKN